MGQTGITIRRLDSTEEYAAAEQLQQVCWQSDPIEAVPYHLMVTLQHEGGLVLGAFTAEGRLVGFVLGFLGREGDSLKHCSHMAAVHPDFRNQDIAYRLKIGQREYMLADGLDVATWTFDPLLAPNAVLNIAKLGGISRVYKRHIYGLMRDALNADLPTDRLYVRWEVSSDRVRRCVETGAHVEAPVAANLLTEVDCSGPAPLLVQTRPLPDAEVVGIQIPRHVLALRDHHLQTAIAWRLGTRGLFEAAFGAGYTVVNVTPDAVHPDLLARYTLARNE